MARVKPIRSFGYGPFTYSNLLNTDVYQLRTCFTMYKRSHEITLERRIIIRNSERLCANHAGVVPFQPLTDFITAPITVLPIQFLQPAVLSYKDGAFPLAYVSAYELGVSAWTWY